MSNYTNDSLDEDDSLTTCENLQTIFELILGICGSLMNLMAVIIFLHPKLNSPSKTNKINKLLLFKSISDSLITLGLIYDNFVPDLSKNYGLLIFKRIFIYYVNFIAQLSSMLLEVFISFDRYVLITQHFLFFFNLNYLWLIVAIYLYSALFYVHKFFQYYIGPSSSSSLSNSTQDYQFYQTNFYKTSANKALGLVHSIQRDFVCVFLIIVLNVLLLIKIKKLMTKKRQMKSIKLNNPKQKVFSLESKKKSKSRKEDKTEIKLTIMVMLTGILITIGHFLTIISYLPIDLLLDSCFDFFKFTIYFMSFSVNFIFYISFNNLFRETFLSLVFIFRQHQQNPAADRNQTKNDNNNSTLLNVTSI